MVNPTFRAQIDEDIILYQQRHPHVDNIKKPEWAFNFWVLDKLFGEDEDAIEGEITDYSDHGIDCFVWHEDSRDLYLIQNKYYGDETSFGKSYFNDAVQDAYGQLLNSTYNRSPELQTIFNKYHDDPDFYVYHYFYVTNNKHSVSVDAAVQEFNEHYKTSRRTAKIFYLDDIQEAFYGEPIHEKPHFTAVVRTVNKGTTLNVDNKSYGLGFDIDAKYIMLPVTTLYEMLEKAEDEQYPIFDANIREYLGTGRIVNKRIIETLQSVQERKRFFFYNNGITIICSDIYQTTTKNGLQFTLYDPQIVNGCQTVSSIQHVLSKYHPSMLADEFVDVYVMAKVLVIPNDGDEEIEDLRKCIVKYNNSQNSIDEKSFAANQQEFRRIQTEFAKYGFLVLLKQSDRERFGKEYKFGSSKLLGLADDKLKQFGLDGKLTVVKDFMVPLDKLLQVVLAFAGDAQQAFQKKGQLLKTGSTQWGIVTDAIKSPLLTTQGLLDLWLLYLRSEQEKSDNIEDGKIPITWYLIEGFAKYECGGSLDAISSNLMTVEDVNRVIRIYMIATQMYLDDYRATHQDGGYNTMIKEKINFDKFNSHHSIAKNVSAYKY